MIELEKIDPLQWCSGWCSTRQWCSGWCSTRRVGTVPVLHHDVPTHYPGYPYTTRTQHWLAGQRCLSGVSEAVISSPGWKSVRHIGLQPFSIKLNPKKHQKLVIFMNFPVFRHRSLPLKPVFSVFFGVNPCFSVKPCLLTVKNGQNSQNPALNQD